VGAVIKDDQVILVARYTQNKGVLEVIVYKVKWSNDPRRGARKGQPDMPTKLAGMTQGMMSVPREGNG
jgi:hypothetical protein